MSSPVGWDRLPGAVGALDDLLDVDVSSTPPTDGDVLTYDSTTGLWLPAAPTSTVGGSSVPAVWASRSSGNVIVGNSYMAVDAALDLTLPAVVGDVLEVGVGALWDANSSVFSMVDAVTRVGEVNVNYVSGNGAGGLGAMAWFAQPGSLVVSTGSIMYTVQSADLSAGTVTVRLVAKASGTSTRTVRGGASDRLQFFMKNLG